MDSLQRLIRLPDGFRIKFRSPHALHDFILRQLRVGCRSLRCDVEDEDLLCSVKHIVVSGDRSSIAPRECMRLEHDQEATITVVQLAAAIALLAFSYDEPKPS